FVLGGQQLRVGGHLRELDALTLHAFLFDLPLVGDVDPALHALDAVTRGQNQSLKGVQNNRDALTHWFQGGPARVDDQQRERKEGEHKQPQFDCRALLEQLQRAVFLHESVEPSTAADGVRNSAVPLYQSYIKTLPSFSRCSSASPQPRTTQVSGSSATTTGRPVSSCRDRKSTRLNSSHVKIS